MNTIDDTNEANILDSPVVCITSTEVEVIPPKIFFKGLGYMPRILII